MKAFVYIAYLIRLILLIVGAVSGATGERIYNELMNILTLNKIPLII